MGQRLRVAGWLRFSSKGQLTKGLKGFRARQAPGYFVAEHWDVAGLDARLRHEAELPGDFSDVERPFMAMVAASCAGYLDYFEEGKTENHGGQHKPVKRWDREVYREVPSAMKGPLFIKGTSGFEFTGKTSAVHLHGELTFPDAALAVAARAPFALPYLEAKDFRELVLAPEGEGKKLTFSLALTTPIDGLYYRVLEAPLVAWARAITAGAKGALTLELPEKSDETRRYRVTDGEATRSFSREPMPKLKGIPKLEGAVVKPTIGNG